MTCCLRCAYPPSPAGHREVDLPPYLPPLQDSGPAPSLPSLLRVAGMNETTVCPDMPFLHRCTDRAGCGHATCRHCGNRGPKGKDHTCPCPFHDNDCKEHMA